MARLIWVRLFGTVTDSDHGPSTPTYGRSVAIAVHREPIDTAAIRALRGADKGKESPIPKPQGGVFTVDLPAAFWVPCHPKEQICTCCSGNGLHV